MQTPSLYAAALDGYIKRRSEDHKLDLLAARAVSIWSRMEPRKIPSAKALMSDKSTRKERGDVNANARAWVTVLNAMNKGKPDE